MAGNQETPLPVGACFEGQGTRWDGKIIREALLENAQFNEKYIEVCYCFNDVVDKEFKKLTREAIAEIEAVCSGIKFKENPCAKNRIEVYMHEKDTKSYVGMIGGMQKLWLANWAKKHDVIHELMHALGFNHEHQRKDRDNHVVVFADCVPEHHINYGYLNSAIDHGEYDYESIMHYPTSTRMQRRDGKPMMTQNARLSHGDIRALNTLYPPLKGGANTRGHRDTGRYPGVGVGVDNQCLTITFNHLNGIEKVETKNIETKNVEKKRRNRKCRNKKYRNKKDRKKWWN
ncbi:unnamed protein product [Rotaria magnacalcarata]|uniref:Metalloendopeptidase n=1 Tax=Rotaria magnacalcarata TaxID=392030 RepID=A0A816PFS5_9BILA|nr:unnamed protein product [Rotaria magnacalcarata]